jgi:hypothetical protein
MIGTIVSTTVKVGLKFVRNLGNYESLHVDIGVEDSVRQGETVDQATERVYAFVEKKLLEKVQAATEELGD